MQNLSKTLIFTLILLALSSCQEGYTPTKSVKIDENASEITTFPSVFDAFSCISGPTALVAAHRGTVENTKLPENALLSLKALHQNGVQFAEIDIARLKDGTHILFHDGVWDEKSTGRGPIAATKWSYAKTILLNDTNGQLTTTPPSRFSEVLSWAKNRMYLEIDFKSSANPNTVINLIRNADMMDQVILIAYNIQQALDLHELAPNAMISVSIFKTGDLRAIETRGLPTKNIAAWVGNGDVSPNLLKHLRKKNVPILIGSFFSLDDQLQRTSNFNPYETLAGPADLIVSDFAFDVQKKLDSYGNHKKNYEECLTEKTSTKE